MQSVQQTLIKTMLDSTVIANADDISCEYLSEWEHTRAAEWQRRYISSDLKNI